MPITQSQTRCFFRWLLARDGYSLEARVAIKKLRGFSDDEDVQVCLEKGALRRVGYADELRIFLRKWRSSTYEGRPSEISVDSLFVVPSFVMSYLEAFTISLYKSVSHYF